MHRRWMLRQHVAQLAQVVHIPVFTRFDMPCAVAVDEARLHLRLPQHRTQKAYGRAALFKCQQAVRQVAVVFGRLPVVVSICCPGLLEFAALVCLGDVAYRVARRCSNSRSTNAQRTDETENQRVATNSLRMLSHVLGTSPQGCATRLRQHCRNRICKLVMPVSSRLAALSKVDHRRTRRHQIAVPKPAQSSTRSHSSGQASADGLPGRNKHSNAAPSAIAAYPTVRG